MLSYPISNDPYELILEHLRALRLDTAELKTDFKDLKQSVNSLRTEVNALRGDILRQERALATVEVDIDRIKARLDLSAT